MAKYLEFDTPAIKQAGDLASDYRLKNHGLIYLDRVFWNLPTPALCEEAVFRGEGHMTHGGAFVVHTGKHTARAGTAHRQTSAAPAGREGYSWLRHTTR